MTASSSQPIVSVIIPTHNRCAILKRTLDALANQTYPCQKMEVLVVIDGSTDSTSEMLAHYQSPFPLEILEQASQGAAAARNRGAEQAKGSLLLFLDDDVVPTPSLVEAHVRAHKNEQGQVVIGPYPPVAQSSVNSYFHAEVRNWWKAKFHELGRPDHRFSYQDLLSGNFSIEVATFTKVGGFDTDPVFQAHEDYELGIRLIKDNVAFRYEPKAVGFHHETIDIRRSLSRVRQEGRADVRIGKQYPELRSGLPLVEIFSHLRSRYKLVLIIFSFIWPYPGHFITAIVLPALAWSDRLRLSRYWQYLYDTLHWYWYWWGVVDGLKSWQKIAKFIRAAKTHQPEMGLTIDINLADGIEEAKQLIDQRHPLGIRVWYEEQFVGCVSPQPGLEPLKGIHLDSILTTALAVPLLETLASKEAIIKFDTVDRNKLVESIKAKSNWFGPTLINQIWYEQYGQWNEFERIKISGVVGTNSAVSAKAH